MPYPLSPLIVFRQSFEHRGLHNVGPPTHLNDKKMKQTSNPFVEKHDQESPDLVPLNAMEAAGCTTPLAPERPLSPFSLLDLRANSGHEAVSVKLPMLPKILKPGKQTWFQTLSDEKQWHIYHLFVPEGEFGNAQYLVAPQIAAQLGALTNRVHLVPYFTLEKELNFWALKSPERSNSWSESALEIAGEARTSWRRMVPNSRAGAYDSFGMKEEKPGPIWPEPEEIQRELERAIAGRVIASMDHPEIAKLF
ncbi:MAG: hypothetical protein V4672_10005 [Verrucomicrobiota bacterium]